MKTGIFSGKRAVVTGGSRGIGRGIVRRLGSESAEVCIIACSQDVLADTIIEIEQKGATCYTVSSDLATTDGARTAAERVLSISPRWNILVNCAGNPPGPMLLEMDVDYWDRTFAIHCRSIYPGSVTRA
ncbi:Rhamnolipids biosynthesis 3-oxoacyl-[acyl-carrier-protein] reductase [Bythopirellula polymerisocia]|uniref:Rhamnolipids biosynthesis 3-oxoacyl-[acyl-carrier-protein] reductase n=1 Tax=Bythopirellula polymerisocia TaxID=2528003 RepID=A0A5C6D171_9BACT|nr:Rhamnolipids biosynthesis 3-oxoacyl-[acyl-carrier-protein] reductase [Bythopirellula polymerisocia]